jgi:neutral ceramidase
MLMSGYGNRTDPAVGVHDPLDAVALYLTDGVIEVGLITADLIDTIPEGTARIRALAQERSGVPAEQIMVAMSHTHGGPQTMLWWARDPDELMDAYTTVAVAKMAGALAQAKRSAVNASIGYGRQDCDIATNRRERTDAGVILGVNPVGPTWPYAEVLRVDAAETGQPLAVAIAYASHGTTLGGDNLLYTADYIGPAKRALERAMPGTTALFLAGCSGDINPNPRGTFEDAANNGLRLGCAAAQAAHEVIEMVDDAPLAVASSHVMLGVEPAPGLNDARAGLKRVEAEARDLMGLASGEDPLTPTLDWWLARRIRNARALVESIEGDGLPEGIPMEVQAMVLGGGALVGIPGEIFVEIGRRIADGSPFAETYALSHCNGSAGYVPTESEIADGGYEIDRARAHLYGLTILPDSDAVLVRAGLDALRECEKLLGGQKS